MSISPALGHLPVSGNIQMAGQNPWAACNLNGLDAGGAQLNAEHGLIEIHEKTLLFVSYRDIIEEKPGKDNVKSWTENFVKIVLDKLAFLRIIINAFWMKRVANRGFV